MTDPRVRPVPRRLVITGTLLTAAIVLATVGLAESLRHPHPGGGPVVPELGGDPRDPIECPDPQPREGEQRDQAQLPQRGAREVTSNELYDCPQTFDGMTVVYRGEVVGGLLERDIGVWTQLNDDIYGDPVGPLPTHRDFRGGNAGMGVLLPHDVAAQVAVVGGPRTRGDVVEVTGIFHRVDVDTQEVAVIRAVAGEVVRTGSEVDDPTLVDRQVAAVLLGLLALALVVLERLRARRR